MDLIQNFAHKLIELLSLKFVESSEDAIRQQVIFRYEAMKGKVGHLNNKLQDLSELFRRKDQAIYTAMQKAFYLPHKK